MSDLLCELQGYRLTTAQIYYHLPDHPNVLQEFIWQHHDLAPKFPKLFKFLDFWSYEIEGTLHSVYVARKKLIGPNDSRFADIELTIQ
ncbi:MAG: Usg family protein [Pseudomonadota bacterium]